MGLSTLVLASKADLREGEDTMMAYSEESVLVTNMLEKRTARQIGILALVGLAATGLWASQPIQTGSSELTQSQTSRACSDPLLANTQECSTQTTEGAGALHNPQTPASSVGTFDGPTENRRETYSDVEQLSQPASPQKQESQMPPPPEPLTEFQRFIASTTNQILPIYGASLFKNVPSSFAPLDMTPVPSDYVIGPGDELRIRVWGQMNFQVNATVDRSGEVFLPQVGPVHVAGTAVSALTEHLRTAIGRVYHNFDIAVDLGKIRAIQIYVSGQARRPGVYTVSSLSTLIDALFASGGPSVQGSMRHISLRRGNAVVTEFDLYSLLVRGDKSADVKLQSGDVIFIPPAGSQVAITGSVRVPAIYELSPNDSLASVVALAGGITSTATEARLSIERVEDHRDRHSIEIAYDAGGLATPMSDGDLIHVFSIVPIYRRTVVLRGNTANPGRSAWHPGMRISDLIPDKEALLTRSYWWKRTQLGLPAPDFEPTPGFDDLRQPAQDVAIKLKSPDAFEVADSQDGIAPQQESTGEHQLSKPDDVERRRLSPEQKAGNASLASAESSLASQVKPSGQHSERLSRVPEIDWDYAVIERLDPETMKTRLIGFDLGAVVLRHDPSQDLNLLSGDVVTVYSGADIRIPIAHQTKTVMLDGEFAHAGFYTVEPGETLRRLVDRAGGLTPDAYLYGSEFTRESTRALQQARIDEYVQTLSLRIQRSNLAVASSAVNPSQDLASGASAQNSEKELLASLLQIRATGRIVLEIKPEDTGTMRLPDIALEDGDRFSIPQVPSNVNVVGAVFNQNSFLYSQSRRAATYLRMAGGPSRDADRSQEFIIRADGEVISRQTEGAWGNSVFNNLVVNPGDTIVIPEKAYKPSAWRGVLDWSQLFSQFALGAAALSVIH